MKPEINQIDSYSRRQKFSAVFSDINNKIMDLFETDCITYPEEAEMIEAIIRVTESRKILEVGMYSGFATLHMIRAIYGNGHVTSIDARPAHDRSFFDRPDIINHFTFIEGWTPQIFETLKGNVYDLVFMDSDHSPEHTRLEMAALQPITRKGTVFIFHDIPRIQTLDATEDCAIRKYVNGLIASPTYKGLILPTPARLDCKRVFGEGYNPDLNPHLAVLIRQ